MKKQKTTGCTIKEREITEKSEMEILFLFNCLPLIKYVMKDFLTAAKIAETL